MAEAVGSSPWSHRQWAEALFPTAGTIGVKSDLAPELVSRELFARDGFGCARVFADIAISGMVHGPPLAWKDGVVFPAPRKVS